MCKDLTVSHDQISLVVEAWNVARQRTSSEEKLGIMALFNLFELEPATKTVFGFKVDQDVKSHPMVQGSDSND